ncbi:MAG: hypothetical protein ACLQU1_22005 [Bryobacteraceae bacterium]
MADLATSRVRGLSLRVDRDPDAPLLPSRPAKMVVLFDRDKPADGSAKGETRFSVNATAPRLRELWSPEKRGLRIACLLVIASYFAGSATDGLRAYFTPDDGSNLINMHGVWEHSLADMAGAALRVATGAYRPLGGIYYLVLYRLAGFHPLPFRAVCLSLMLVNPVSRVLGAPAPVRLHRSGSSGRPPNGAPPGAPVAVL